MYFLEDEYPVVASVWPYVLCSYVVIYSETRGLFALALELLFYRYCV